jgi:hypothetical protein
MHLRAAFVASLAALTLVYMNARPGHAQAPPGTLSAADVCTSYEDQLQRDQTAMRRQQETIKLGNQQLEEWTEANKEAEIGALKAGFNLFVDGVVRKLLPRQEALEKLSKSLARGSSTPGQILLSRIADSDKAYAQARRLENFRNLAPALATGESLWALMQNEVKAVAELVRHADDNVNAVLQSPEYRQLAATDVTFSELGSSLAGFVMSSEQLDKFIGPHAALASFVVDYGYNAFAWLESRDRILQQTGDGGNADLQLRAVRALTQQTMCTVGRLQDCRAGQAPRTCEDILARRESSAPQNNPPAVAAAMSPPAPPLAPPKSGSVGVTVAKAGATAGAAIVGGVYLKRELDKLQTDLYAPTSTTTTTSAPTGGSSGGMTYVSGGFSCTYNSGGIVNSCGGSTITVNITKGMNVGSNLKLLTNHIQSVGLVPTTANPPGRVTFSGFSGGGWFDQCGPAVTRLSLINTSVSSSTIVAEVSGLSLPLTCR